MATIPQAVSDALDALGTAKDQADQAAAARAQTQTALASATQADAQAQQDASAALTAQGKARADLNAALDAWLAAQAAQTRPPQRHGGMEMTPPPQPNRPTAQTARR